MWFFGSRGAGIEPQACLAPVSRAWPAYLGEIGRCLRPSLESGRCFLGVGRKRREPKKLGKTLEKHGKTKEKRRKPRQILDRFARRGV